MATGTPAHTDFPDTELEITGARLAQIAKATRENSQAGDNEQRLMIGSPGGAVAGNDFNPRGARHYLSHAEGSGYWDILSIMDGLLLSIADAQYRKPVRTYWPDDKVLKVRITLSGRMLDIRGNPIAEPGGCTLSCYSGKSEVPYVLEAVDQPCQQVCIHVARSTLQRMNYDAEALGEPFRSFLEHDRLPDSHQTLSASHTLIGLARDMVQSRDMFSADTRRFYLGARSLEILVTAIELLRPRKVPNTGANRVTQRDVSRISEARRILEASYASPPTIHELSRLVGINTTKLKLGFREIFDKTIQEFIVGLRMENGLMLIETTDLSISEIAYRVGYAYPASFTQAVRKHFGKTPQDIRGKR